MRDLELQSHVAPLCNTNIPQAYDNFEQWKQMPESFPFDNGFKIQREMFLKHVAFDTPHEFDLFAGTKGVQFAELGIES